MLHSLVGFFAGLPKEYLVVIMGALPVSELRGAIPLGLYFGMPLSKTFWLAVLGNMIPVVPALFLFEPVSGRLRKIRLWRRFFDWLFERTRRNSDNIQKYEALGLFLFVAIPLPMTGAWSGIVAASLFRIRFRYALPAIIMGILSAGLVVTALCMVGMLSWDAMAK